MNTFEQEFQPVDCIYGYSGFSESDGVQIDGPPTYATLGAAAVDLRTTQCLRCEPKAITVARTALKLHLPDGVAALVMPRSGLGTKGLILANTIGLIDSDYQGEIIVNLYNRSDRRIDLREGDRVAQLMFINYVRVRLNSVLEFTEKTERGEGGFGSTGGFVNG